MSRRVTFLNSQRRLSPTVPQLVQQLQKQHNESMEAHRMHLLSQRKLHLKIKRSLRLLSIENPTIIIQKQLRNFSTESPINKGDPFVQMRRRRNLIVPDRAFQRSPNMRGGSYGKQLFHDMSQNDSRRVIDLRFQQYVRVMEEQDGKLKKERVDKLKKYKKCMKFPMKQTFFSKMQADGVNFYRGSVGNANDQTRQWSTVETRPKIFDLTSIGKMRTPKNNIKDITSFRTPKD